MKAKVKNEAGRRPRSAATLCMVAHLNEAIGSERYGVEMPVTSGRRWRFDFAIPDEFIAIEIEGGAWTRGRHTRGKGFIADMDKYNHATLEGYRILRFTPDQVLRGEAIAFIKRVLES